MTDYSELIARVRSPFALTERDAQEIADALEAQAKEIAELEADNKKLREELRACADDLEAELRAKYGCVKGGPIHPAENKRFQRDMDSVYAARAALKGEN